MRNLGHQELKCLAQESGAKIQTQAVSSTSPLILKTKTKGYIEKKRTAEEYVLDFNSGLPLCGRIIGYFYLLSYFLNFL